MHSHSADQGDEVNAYVEALEAERMKMMMFKSALPLSIELVSRTIDSCKERLSSGVERQHVCESSSEETTSDDVDVHVLEFIPIKRCSNGSSSESEDIQPSNDDKDDIYDVGKKSDWLSSAQLWNMSPDLPSKSEELENLEGKCKSSDKDLEEKSCNPKKAESSSTESQKSGGECKKDDKEGNSKRKQRRCWSQDLHRRFLHSLKQLGGAHIATPKQIRELMKVDGLTNDEVKSHLQKYRLHTRRPTPPSIQCNAEAPPQFVVEGNIWAPTSRGSNGALGTSGTCVYIPMGAPPPAQPQSWQEQPFNQISQIKSKNPEVLGDGLARCISPSMSSSTRTTASQVY